MSAEFVSLPTAVLVNVLCPLAFDTAKEARSLALVCKRLAMVTRQRATWEGFLKRRNDELVAALGTPRSMTWPLRERQPVDLLADLGLSLTEIVQCFSCALKTGYGGHSAAVKELKVGMVGRRWQGGCFELTLENNKGLGVLRMGRFVSGVFQKCLIWTDDTLTFDGRTYWYNAFLVMCSYKKDGLWNVTGRDFHSGSDLYRVWLDPQRMKGSLNGGPECEMVMLPTSFGVPKLVFIGLYGEVFLFQTAQKVKVTGIFRTEETSHWDDGHAVIELSNGEMFLPGGARMKVTAEERKDACVLWSPGASLCGIWNLFDSSLLK